MSLIQESINTFVITKLNLNTKSLTFKSGYIFWIEDGKMQTNTITGYKIVSTEFIPVMIQDWRNTSQPFPSVDKQGWILPISFAIPQTKLADAMVAINEFRDLLQGTQVTVDSHNIGLRVGQPTAPSNPVPHNQEHYVMVDIILMADASIGLNYGNSVGLEMGLTGGSLSDLIFQKMDIQTDLIVEASDDTTDGVTQIYNKHKSTWQMDLVVLGTTAADTLFMDELWQDATVTQKYDMTVTYSRTVPVVKSETVIIKKIIQHIEYGVALGYQMTLFKG